MATTTMIEIFEDIPAASTYGKFRYIPRGVEPTSNPHLYHLPELKEFADVRSLPLHDIRPLLDSGSESTLKLSEHGFTARRYPSMLHSAPYTRASWDDVDTLRNVYFPEVEALVKQVTGAKSTIVEVAVMRNTTFTEVDGLAVSEEKDAKITSGNAQGSKPRTEPDSSHDPDFPKMIGVNPGFGASPAPKVHLDYAPSGARTHLRKYHPNLASFAAPIIAAEDSILASGIPVTALKYHYDGPRWAMFSIWRPLKTVRRDPLALSDCRTFPKEDYVSIDITTPTSTIGGRDEPVDTHIENSFLAHGSDKHDWYWISAQEPEEVLIIQLFDSEAEKRGHGVAGGVMHSSVDIAGTEDEAPRESLETRVIAVW